MKTPLDHLTNKLYMLLINGIGLTIFFVFGAFTFNNLSDWVLGYALIGANLLLTHFRIQMPPEGNSMSMDSAVYLACLFYFDIQIALSVLFYTSIIQFIYERKTAWWVHLYNFSIYSIMIYSSYFVFQWTNGSVGNIHLDSLYSYVIALTWYFMINALLIMLYFVTYEKKNNAIKMFKGMTRGTIESYVSTLILAIVLVLLFQSEPFFGLMLFVGLALILSFAFKQHFKLYKDAARKANIDQLTGLFNHGYTKELLDKVFRESKENHKPLSIAFIDIDDFKKYNNGNGHLKGDKLLEELGKQLGKSVKDTGYSIGRFSGEEFVFILPDTTAETASSFIDCLRKTVNDTYYDGVELLPYGCLSFSAGIAQLHPEIVTPSELLSKAAQAMSYAKMQGKNNTHIFGNEIEEDRLEAPIEEIEQQLNILLAKDIYTYRHSKRVYKYAVEFSQLLDLKDQERKQLILGALIHDIGKVEVPREIINKQGKLDYHEWEIIKKHVTWGHEIVSSNKKFESIAPLVELHHERFDGKGYPHGLSGQEIPKLARILCVIDSFDAMTTERPYQRTKSFPEAIAELKACAGSQFDKDIVEPFVRYIESTYPLTTETVDVL
ncbi:diguanylate cyclase [Radiobacillus kanasensis]|uniref:bifunctional diguanylate cyclase/phosphohydrolase n=1 Tax=Radiobacillus kanasensis TaxID=2844358 RepID=UPI001E38E245|nr:diguanylate cyclase [Radiobacillus kanasensis]UFT98630.1 diguanylate cyclase [Radiobacillus kanasensis]